ncbi:hypothetical protein [Polaribacter porphyrae]|uniref:Fibronectin type-III domain-containing protein n=1 Tax=Polaribacter porphyrae TaxID=1137780 RepID=A0A2S7WRT4_9FLAO|nr:hypothetical protein [Polaribacter porphyrae]PQJ80294.1 hypothetical protein BTO18_14395 [Polaribacter porphyrae]
MKRLIYPILLLFIFISCEAIFIEDISDTKVILLAPTNNAEVVTGSIQFNWEEVIDASEYNIQIASPSFNQANQIVLDSVTTSSIITKELDVGSYEWRVKASNSGYQTNYTTNSFTVK